MLQLLSVVNVRFFFSSLLFSVGKLHFSPWFDYEIDSPHFLPLWSTLIPFYLVGSKFLVTYCLPTICLPVDLQLQPDLQLFLVCVFLVQRNVYFIYALGFVFFNFLYLSNGVLDKGGEFMNFQDQLE